MVEAEAVEAEAKEEEEGLDEGLLQMKLPESVKLQVTRHSYINLIFTSLNIKPYISNPCFCLFSDVHTAAVLLRLRAATQSRSHRGLFRPVCPGYPEQPAGSIQPADESLHHVGC